MDEGHRASRSTGVKEKIYNMLQYGVPLSEEDKEAALNEVCHKYFMDQLY